MQHEMGDKYSQAAYVIDRFYYPAPHRIRISVSFFPLYDLYAVYVYMEKRAVGGKHIFLR